MSVFSKRIFQIFLSSFLCVNALSATEPNGYYSSCEGKSGAGLLTALCSKIGPHTNVGYDGLWNVYTTSDVRADGSVWDMYSTKAWVVGKEHCGNYSRVGDCINREHSMPKSWFSEGSPMKSDAFHVYPTDGKVNGQRSNYPYGECDGGTTLASNGTVKALGKLGRSTFPGYTGTVFEPVDEYKGDFARTYFYMAACYNDKISGWSSDMLAQNKFPVFKQWAIELLMKWHREDPVSQKERDRNEAVYAHQKNRNPFIDHPEMAEHIWGSVQNTGWTSNTTPTPEFVLPANGSVVNMGLIGVSATKSVDIKVLANHLTSDVSVGITGTGFSVTPSAIAKSAACSAEGTTVKVTYNSVAPMPSAQGVLTLKSGAIQTQVVLTVSATDVLTALGAIDITEDTFTARWVNLDGAETDYELTVKCGTQILPDYPKQVPSASERYVVRGLTAGTDYSYYLKNPDGLLSNTVNVTTAVPIPSIQFLFDGDLYFTAKPGEASAVAELLLDAENVAADIIVATDAPFQISTDKMHWGTNITLHPDEDRFYLRLLSDAEGVFTATLRAYSTDCDGEDVELEGLVSSAPAFTETFEKPSALSSYNGGIYEGSACEWHVTGALVGNDPRDRHSGAQGFRMHKTATYASSLEMAQAKSHGAGTVTFWAKAWDGESGNVELSYSTDGGVNWTKVADFAIGDNNWSEYKAEAKVSGDVRLRFNRTAGRRICIDDIEVSDYTVSAVQQLDYHSWDAFALNGNLVVENYSTEKKQVTVYTTDGRMQFKGAVKGGQTVISLPSGALYIVTVDGFSRRVVIR